MIPKIIHYCWFGRGEMPKLAFNCIESWKTHLPDYEYKLWNEDTFDVNSNRFCREAYISKKYAFVTDYVRLFALYNDGGIYLDTDVEILKNLDEFLFTPAFSGFESDTEIPTGIMGSEKFGQWAKEQLEYYKDLPFIKKNGSINIKTNVTIITENMIKLGFIPNNQFQIVNEYFYIYPKDYFCPKSWQTGEIDITENTFCIHHFAASWLSSSKFENVLMRYFGKVNGNRIIKFSRIFNKHLTRKKKIK